MQSLQIFKTELLKFYAYTDVLRFFRSNETRNDNVYYDLVKRRKLYSQTQLEYYRQSYRKDKKLIRSYFSQALGLHSTHIKVKKEKRGDDVEMSILLALAFCYKSDNKQYTLRCLDVPRSDVESTSQRSLYVLLSQIGVIANSYGPLSDLYDRAEYFYLHYVTPLDDDMFVFSMSLIRDVFSPRTNGGDIVPMRKIRTAGMVIGVCPKDVGVPLEEGSSKEMMVKTLKSIQNNIGKEKSLKGQNNGFYPSPISKQDMTVYFFVVILTELPENVVPIVYNYNGNMGMLSGLLSYFKKTLYFVDSVEKPRYHSAKASFNDYLKLKTPEIELQNAWKISYTVPSVDFDYRKTELIMKEFKDNKEVQEFQMFRCVSDIATMYDKGYPDYSNSRTVWVVRQGGHVLEQCYMSMAGYFMCHWMFGSYLSYDLMTEFSLPPFEIVKVVELDVQESDYRRFKSKINPKKEDEDVIEDVDLKRSKQTHVENVRKEDPLVRFESQIKAMNEKAVRRDVKLVNPVKEEIIVAPVKNEPIVLAREEVAGPVEILLKGATPKSLASVSLSEAQKTDRAVRYVKERQWFKSQYRPDVYNKMTRSQKEDFELRYQHFLREEEALGFTEYAGDILESSDSSAECSDDDSDSDEEDLIKNSTMTRNIPLGKSKK